LHYVRAKDGAEVDLFLSDKTNAGDTPTHLIECKFSDSKTHRALTRFAKQGQGAKAVQIAQNLRAEYELERIKVRRASTWLMNLDA
jgi:hypothetical protein